MSLSDDEALFEDLYGEEEEAAKVTPPASTGTTATTTDSAKTEEGVKKEEQEGSVDATPSAAPAVSAPAAVSGEDKKNEQQPQVSIDQESSTPLSQPPSTSTSSSTATAPSTSALPSRKADLSRDAGKMFVGGLDWDTSEEKFRSYFAKYGEVLDHTIMRDANGRSRGFGFLTFSSKKSVDEVLKTQHILDGKVIDPKRAIPREEQDKTGKIFVGGIAPEVRPHEFEAFFSKYGEIIDAQLMLDKDTGKSRGFGFVTFDSPDAVEKVCTGKYLDFNGRQIEVKRAEPRGPQQQQNHIQSQQQRLFHQQQQNPNYYNNQSSAAAMGQPQVQSEEMAQYWQQMQQYWAQVQSQAAQAGGNSSDPNMAAQMAAYTQQLQQYQQQMMAAAAAQAGGSPQVPTAGGSDENSQEDNSGQRSYGKQGYNQYGQNSYNNQGYNNYNSRGRGNFRGGRGGRGNYRGGYNNRGGNNNGGRGGYHPYQRYGDNAPSFNQSQQHQNGGGDSGSSAGSN